MDALEIVVVVIAVVVVVVIVGKRMEYVVFLVLKGGPTKGTKYRSVIQIMPVIVTLFPSGLCGFLHPRHLHSTHALLST